MARDAEDLQHAQQETEKVHVLAVPFQQDSHIRGMLSLAQAMAAMGIIVTFIYPARFHALAYKRGILSSLCKSSNSRLRFVVAEDGLPTHESCSLTDELLRISIPIFENSVKLILDRLLSEASSSALPMLSCLISDCITPWTKHLAAAAGLPRVPFWTSTAASFSMSAHLPLLISEGHVPVKKECWVDGSRWTVEAPLVECIPGLPPFHITDLPSEYAHAEMLSDPCLQFLAAACEGAREAPLVLLHCVYDLESPVLDALQTQGFAVEAVGPLLYHSVSERYSHESLQWLDKQRPSSVMYVALGTVSHLPLAETRALALGLEASGCPFLWVIRPDEVLEALPEGFLDRTVAVGSGLILPWVPQQEVLHHSSICAFFSHCGWNSTLESMWEGVPMVACPLGMEQRSNSRWILEHWKMGVDLKRQVDGSFTEEAVEAALRDVKDETYRKGAARVKEICRLAVQEGGTSYTNLIRLRKLLLLFHDQGTCRHGEH